MKAMEKEEGEKTPHRWDKNKTSKGSLKKKKSLLAGQGQTTNKDWLIQKPCVADDNKEKPVCVLSP